MDLKDKVLKSLKATLISTKGAITLRQCNLDYRELEGENIPYKKIGYSSLDELFLACPDFRVTKSPSGEMLVDAAPNRETSHISSLIMYQKSAKKPSRATYKGRFPNKNNNWRRPTEYAPKSRPYRQETNYYPPQRSTKQTKSDQSYYTPPSRPRYESPPRRQNSQRPPAVQPQPVPVQPKPVPVQPKPVPVQPPALKPILRTFSNDNNKENVLKITPKPSAHVRLPEPKVPDFVGKAQVDRPAASKEPASRRATRQKEPKSSHNTSNPARSTALQRLNALRKSLNTVDVIPLPIPAVVANELLFQESVPEPVQPEIVEEPFPVDGTTEIKLTWFCRHLNLQEPVYKVHENKPKRGPSTYDCSIKIGSTHSASSYPNSTPTIEEARDKAASKLVAILEKELNSLPTSPAPLALERLAELLKSHPAGLWASTIPQLYKEQHQEILPMNWEKLVESSPFITMDRLANGLPVLIASENLVEPYDHSNATSVSSDTEASLPPLHFPDSEYWNVFVTAANSTIEVWLRLVGEEYSDAYDNLVSEMNDFYEHGGAPVSAPTEDFWYVVRMEEGWLRAKLLEVTEDGGAAVFLIDHGDDEVVSISDLRHLEPQFSQLPAQAILCRLDGLEEMGSCLEVADLIRNRLVNEALVAAPGVNADGEHTIPIRLFDTSGAKDVDLNAQLIDDFTKAAIPCITNEVQDVEVSCVSKEGRVWVCAGWGAGAVRGALLMLTEPGPYSKPPPPSHITLHRDELYAVQTAQGEWVRCAVRNFADESDVVSVRLVDSGRSMRAPAVALHPLSVWSPALNKIPPQAMQVRLAGADAAANALSEKLRELLVGRRVLCRAATKTSSGDGQVPPVDLFVRTEPQNILASVNNAIYVEWDLIKKGKTVEDKKPNPTDDLERLKALERKKEKIFSHTPSFGGPASIASTKSTNSPMTDYIDMVTGLPTLQLPPVGSSFDVYITMAASPWNFWLQPNSSRKELKAMMSTLQADCSSMAQISGDIKPGELYAAYLDKDGSWYRVAAVRSFSADLISVSFIDYGDLDLIQKKNLRVIPPLHPARKLSAQAAKATLHDICPNHKDWTPEDCVKFQELAVEQQLVAIVKEQTPKLSIELIDTSTEDDINIASILCKENRATKGQPTV